MDMRYRALVYVILPALLLGLVGCGEKEVVEVVGAVKHPGNYAYRPEWTGQDYVTAAGGFLPEAHIRSERSSGWLRTVRRESSRPGLLPNNCG